MWIFSLNLMSSRNWTIRARKRKADMRMKTKRIIKKKPKYEKNCGWATWS